MGTVDRADPFQLANLADDSEQATAKADLEKLVEGWLDSTEDPFADSTSVAGWFIGKNRDNMQPYYHDDLMQMKWQEEGASGRSPSAGVFLPKAKPCEVTSVRNRYRSGKARTQAA